MSSFLPGSIANIDAANKSKKAIAKAAKATNTTSSERSASSSSIIRKPKVVWTDEEINLLCDYLQEARDEGMWGDNGFKATAYVYAANKLEDPLKTSGAQGPVQTKWARIKKDYLQVKSLLDTSGFGWDEETKLPTAEDSIWDEIAKVSIIVSITFIFI